MCYREWQRLIKNAKDCHYCSSPAGKPYIRTESKMFQVRCNFCGACGPTSETPEHAVEVWNAENPGEYFGLLRSWHPEAVKAAEEAKEKHPEL